MLKPKKKEQSKPADPYDRPIEPRLTAVPDVVPETTIAAVRTVIPEDAVLQQKKRSNMTRPFRQSSANWVISFQIPRLRGFESITLDGASVQSLRTQWESYALGRRVGGHPVDRDTESKVHRMIEVMDEVSQRT